MGTENLIAIVSSARTSVHMWQGALKIAVTGVIVDSP
jgi:hypothetical protein